MAHLNVFAIRGFRCLPDLFRSVSVSVAKPQAKLYGVFGVCAS